MLRWEAVDLAAMLGAVAEDAAEVAARKGCALQWRVAPALGPVPADRDHLEKILLNLVSNALKFTPADGWIRIEASAVDEDWFQLEVADSGIGIDADKLPLLFTRFQQVDSSATRQYGGTGLGLALVKELTEQMGGRVAVASTPGEGSSFRVQLPRAVPAALTSTVVRAALGALPETQAALRRTRLGEGLGERPADLAAGRGAASNPLAAQILVADDSPELRHYIARLLADEHHVLLAADGLQAWALLRRQAVDVVVADVMMPNMDGLELTARIKGSREFAHLPVLLVTARGGAEACSSSLETGADDYLAKPFAPEELKARVRAALRMRRVQDELREKSRDAGMAMVASGILHNLGNALVGVNLASGSILEKLQRSRLPKLCHATRLLRAPDGERPAAEQPVVGTVAAYLQKLAEHLQAEQQTLIGEVETLRSCTEHVVGVIAAHRGPGRGEGALRERLRADALMEMALQLARGICDVDGIRIRRDYASTAAVLVERHKVLQILLNLLTNACQALDGTVAGGRCIHVRTARAGACIRLEVGDNGVGIEARHLSALFDQRFSTRGDGHGYGLHSSANWAHELGGSPSAHSDGPGCGAVFTLALPLAADDAADTSSPPSPVVAGTL